MTLARKASRMQGWQILWACEQSESQRGVEVVRQRAQGLAGRVVGEGEVVAGERDMFSTDLVERLTGSCSMVWWMGSEAMLSEEECLRV